MPINCQCEPHSIYGSKLTFHQGRDVDLSKPYENEAIIQTIHQEFFSYYMKAIDKEYPDRFPGARNTWKLYNSTIALAATGVSFLVQHDMILNYVGTRRVGRMESRALEGPALYGEHLYGCLCIPSCHFGHY
jgi:hypothetical protein